MSARWRRVLLSAVAVGGGCVALGLISALPAGARAWTPVKLWMTPVSLSKPRQEAIEPQVGMDAAGDATVVWEGFNGTSGIEQAVYKPAGKPWEAPVTISEPGNEEGGRPQVAVDAAGDAAAVWVSSGTVRAAFRPAGGAWGTPVSVSEAGHSDRSPLVAMDAAGNTTVVWEGFGGIFEAFVQSAYKPAGAPWQAPVRISEAGQNATDARFAVDPAGYVIAVWQLNKGAEQYFSQAAYKPAGEPWEAPVSIPESQKSFFARVAVDAAGDATVVWLHHNGVEVPNSVQSVYRPAGGPWQAPVTLAAEVPGALEPQVAMDAGGDATTIWEFKNFVQAGYRPAGKPWEAPVDLNNPKTPAGDPKIAMEAAGDTTATWVAYIGHKAVVQAAHRTAGEPWGAPVTLADQKPSSLQLAVDPTGEATEVWDRRQGTSSNPYGYYYVAQASQYP
jgi:hypothetical protein